MELVQEYYSIWFERKKLNKSRWIEGCEELISNTLVKHRLRHPVVPGKIKIFHCGRVQVEGVDFIITEDIFVHFLNHTNPSLPASIEYTGYAS